MTNSPAPRQDHTPTWLYAMLMIGGLVVAVVFTSVIWIRFEKMNQPRIPAASTSTGLPSWIPPSENNPGVDEPMEPEPDQNTPTVLLEVEWSSPQSVDFYSLLDNLDSLKNSTSTAKEILDEATRNYSTGPNGEVERITAEKRGIVKNGPYVNWTFYALEIPCYDLGCPNPVNMILSQDRTQALAIGDEYGLSISSVVPYAKNTSVKYIELPDQITLSNGETLIASSAGSYFHSGTDRTKWKDTGLRFQGYKIYSTDGGCLAIITEDQQAHGFSSRFNAENLDGYKDTDAYANTYFDKNDIPSEEINWSITPVTSTVYRSNYSAGCGSTDCPVIVADDIKPRTSDLIQIGTNKDGDPIYTVKNLAQSKITQSVYEMWYFYAEGKEKPPVEEFLKTYPVPYFLWKDALGRYAVYTLSNLAPLAECGKPVIYLYPEEKTNVSVRLPSFINVTVSEPTYPKQGWTTTAHPDGTLVMPDGSKYGSLFWEGTGVSYKTPTEGWLVKDGEQETFLKETLARLGLNETESKEFMEFWLPLMQDAPYYRVSFIVSEWSKAAPLYVSPKPTTQIRIFMDWEKRSSPISIQAPKIETPKREGFTLVEWGGLLRK
ncbi:hypothetical protein IT407_01945 [Candidatus Uhrbacteria bacterium]|nr:hypothetical protein [Candidatus Uhrbacteria bacterium]